MELLKYKDQNGKVHLFTNKQAMTRFQRKEKAVVHKGGRCIICGYDTNQKALTFRHRISNTKKYNIGDMTKLSWNKCKAELDKCDLLCCNCHAEIHS